MEISEIIIAYGHENILATHKSTLEITKDTKLSKKGDCIIAVAANKALTDFSPQFRQGLCKENAEITISIEAGDVVEVINAFGSPRLILSHLTDMVVRKSSHICSRTVAIKADKAAYDMSRKFVEKLKRPEQKVRIALTARF